MKDGRRTSDWRLRNGVALSILEDVPEPIVTANLDVPKEILAESCMHAASS
jgi:hypothetical protein